MANMDNFYIATSTALRVNDIGLKIAPWRSMRLTEKTSMSSSSWSSSPASGRGILWASWRISCRRRSDRLTLSNGRSPDIFILDKNSSQSEAKLRLRNGRSMKLDSWFGSVLIVLYLNFFLKILQIKMEWDSYRKIWLWHLWVLLKLYTCILKDFNSFYKTQQCSIKVGFLKHGVVIIHHLLGQSSVIVKHALL